MKPLHRVWEKLLRAASSPRRDPRRCSSRRRSLEALEDRLVFSTRVLPTPFLPGNCTDQCSCSCAEVSTTTDDGAVTTAPTSGLNLTYNSNTAPAYNGSAAPQPVVGFATYISGFHAPGTLITASSDGDATIPFDTKYFSAPAQNGLNAFGFQAGATELTTGRYFFIATLSYSDDPNPDHHTDFFQFQDVVNRGTSEFGSGWWPPELDKLQPENLSVAGEYADQPQVEEVAGNGVLLVSGDNHAIWFKEDASQTDPNHTTYTRETGNPYSSATLVMNNSDSSYNLTDIDGS
jgi:hypothetical protein